MCLEDLLSGKSRPIAHVYSTINNFKYWDIFNADQ